MLRITQSIFIIIALIVCLASCAPRGKQKVPKSKKMATATWDDTNMFYNPESDVDRKKQAKITKKKRLELDKYQPGPQHYDDTYQKSTKKPKKTPQTFY